MCFFQKKIHILVNAPSAPCTRRAHKHPIIDIYLPIVGRIYPILEYIRQLLAEYIQYQNKCQLLAEYIQYQKISANCWQNYLIGRIYLIYLIGRIYLIPEYIQYQYTYIFNCSYIPQLLAVYIQ